MDAKELIIKDIKVGSGPEVKASDTVVMHYTGWLEDTSTGSPLRPDSAKAPTGEQDSEGQAGKTGKKFDSSLDRKQPFETKIGVGYVIKGWDMGVPGMKVGGKRRLIIPSELGYGKYGAGDDIPPFATLIFEVELLKIK